MIESEVEPMVKTMDTGKFRAACAAVDLPPDSPADVLLDKLVALKKWKDNLMRSRFGLLALLFGTSEDVDDAIDWLMLRSQKHTKKG